MASLVDPVRRERTDRCPGPYRPWLAADGLLVRLRLIGGRIPTAALVRLSEAAARFGDGHLHLTSRANLQVRGLPGRAGRLEDAVLAALEDTGLIPSRTHELIRNVMVSPQTGLAGGRTDLRLIADDLDQRLCAQPELADLPGKFLFALDDGRGDLLGQTCDLGLVALDDTTAQLRVGDAWGEVVPLAVATTELIRLSLAFAHARGSGPTAPWHVTELPTPLVSSHPADLRLPAPALPLSYGDVPGGHHLPVPETGLDHATVLWVAAQTEEIVVTPWRGLLIPTR